jgi:isoquinoline 1-oxidoreductase
MNTPQASLDQELENRQHLGISRLAYSFELKRREFFKLLGCGMLVGLSAGKSLLAQGPPQGGRSRYGEDLPESIDAWLHLSETGAVTVYTGKAEMGQNIRTSLTQQVAEELRVPLSSIQLVMADTALTPFDLGTFGSRTTPTMGPQLRRVACAARNALVSMAAAQWHTDAASLVAQDGKISDPHSQRSISYGELTKGQQLVKMIGDDPDVEAPKDWKVAGTEVAKVDGRQFVTGGHRYASDMVRPGMLHGKVLRPAGFQAQLTSFDAGTAEKMAEVTVVHDGDFIGVAAPSLLAAENAIQKMRAQWKVPSQSANATLYEDLRKPAAEAGREWEGGGRGGPHVVGAIEKAWATADKTLSKTYTVAYIAHTPLEPRAAVAEWQDGKLTVWTGTQRPFAVRDELAENFRVPKENVRVIVPDTGSAYGGKHTGEVAVEAARVAKAASKPVKVVWSREEEFTWAYFRPAGVIDVKAGIAKDGRVVAWQFDNYNSGPSGINTPYDVPNQRIEYHPADSPLRQGSYRGLAATANHFAREVHMDDLAHLANMDPLEFRMKNLTHPRVRAVLQAAAEKFGWGRTKSSSTRGFGLAAGTEKGGYVATCAEVEIQPDRTLKVKRVVEAFECGAIVNPNGLRNQVMGAVMQAIGGALFESIQFANGKILNPHLAQYRVPRFSDMPVIEVALVDRKDLPPAGAGETPIMGLAPAISNAIFAATGIRLRSLPMAADGLPSAS